MKKVHTQGEKPSGKIPLRGNDKSLLPVYYFQHRESTNDKLSQQRPRASADGSSLSICFSSLTAMTELQALPSLLVPDGTRSPE
jgi:hypothetical protein